MNAEDKLFKNVDRLMLHDSLKKNEVLTVWERTFLSSVYSIYRRTSGNNTQLRVCHQSRKTQLFLF